MTEGLFALLGVILGGVVTAGVTFFQEARRTRAARRVAARIMVDQLLLAGHKLHRTGSSGVWAFESEAERQRVLSDAHWIRQRELFASSLSARDWDVVSAAFGWLARLSDGTRDVLPGAEAPFAVHGASPWETGFSLVVAALGLLTPVADVERLTHAEIAQGYRDTGVPRLSIARGAEDAAP